MLAFLLPQGVLHRFLSDPSDLGQARSEGGLRLLSILVVVAHLLSSTATAQTAPARDEAPEAPLADADSDASDEGALTGPQEEAAALIEEGEPIEETEQAQIDAPPISEPADGVREPIRYFVEQVEITGNEVTREAVVRRFVPLEPGDEFDVDDPIIEDIRWRLIGTGYFADVRLRLRRGSRRGWVILVVEVEERNTFVVQQLALGIAQGVSRTSDTNPDLLPYAGLSLAETNLFGLGMQLGVTGVVSRRQQGVRAQFTDPVFLGSRYSLSAGALFVNGLEFFGDDDVLVSIVCPEPAAGEPPEECPEEVQAKNAVVFYKRVGLSLGLGHDLGANTSYRLDWQPELIDVRIRPEAASEVRGRAVDGVEPRAPIDFAVEPDTSFLSVLQLTLTYDRRDNPALPSRGMHALFRGDAGTRLIGSDYSFLRLQVLARKWVPLPWGHHVRFGIFGGALFGDAPFMYKFHASDLSDLIPSRLLHMNLDRRPPPNLLGTSIAEMRSQEFAGRADVEYGLPLYRGDGGVRAINGYLGAGVYTLFDRRDLEVAIPGYGGFSRVPIDLTFDLGVRVDTNIGLFQLGFSTLLGFVTP